MSSMNQPTYRRPWTATASDIMAIVVCLVILGALGYYAYISYVATPPAADYSAEQPAPAAAPARPIPTPIVVYVAEPAQLAPALATPVPVVPAEPAAELPAPTAVRIIVVERRAAPPVIVGSGACAVHSGAARRCGR